MFSADGGGGAPSDGDASCGSLENEISLMDFITDLYDIYRAFTDNMTAAGTPGTPSGPPATGLS